METKFRAVFLTSDKPEATARFYEQVAVLPLETVGTPGGYVYWCLDRDGIQLAIHEAGAFADYAYPPLAGSNLAHLYFKVEDREAFLAHLERLHVQPVAIDEVTVMVADPNGRKVMFGTA